VVTFLEVRRERPSDQKRSGVVFFNRRKMKYRKGTTIQRASEAVTGRIEKKR